ncbi:MAG TPA: hypothetical protein PLL80_01335 [Candidatus Pacearchaeota archaeon]|nr:hypothetical protein [Candidatus Pacearchaeota archaeon]HOK94111.1 hypothetical protein [Candidatus Pacearchaeota archaeon]HPO75239.1 hypothetical protein [Candidatus Pacearchaeota archaeon]
MKKIVSFVAILVLVFWLFGWLNQKEERQQEQMVQPEQASQQSTQQPVPQQITQRTERNNGVVPNGLSSWQEVLTKMENDPDYARLMKEITGLDFETVHSLAVLEKKGLSLKMVVPKGTFLINTGQKNGKYYSIKQSLPKARIALADTNGIPRVLTDCGNPCRVETPKPKPKPKEKSTLSKSTPPIPVESTTTTTTTAAATPITLPPAKEKTKKVGTSLEIEAMIGGGVECWKDVFEYIKSHPEYEKPLKDISGLSLNNVESFMIFEKIVEDTQRDEKLVKILPKGTFVLSAGLRNGEYCVFQQYLSRDEKVLTDLIGTPRILMYCGNPIKVLSALKAQSFYLNSGSDHAGSSGSSSSNSDSGGPGGTSSPPSPSSPPGSQSCSSGGESDNGDSGSSSGSDGGSSSGSDGGSSSSGSGSGSSGSSGSSDSGGPGPDPQ